MSDIGYARVSTKLAKGRKAQHIDNQVERLKDAGCKQIFTDEITGTRASRPGWDECMAELGVGDTLLVTKLDRIGRSLVNLVDVVTLLSKRGVGLRCLDQGMIDTTTSHGKLLFQIMSAMAEWEANIIRERTLEGLEAARERRGGPLPGRGPSFTADQKENAEMLVRTTNWSAERIAATIGVSRATLYRHVPVAEIREALEAEMEATVRG